MRRFRTKSAMILMVLCIVLVLPGCTAEPVEKPESAETSVSAGMPESSENSVSAEKPESEAKLQSGEITMENLDSVCQVLKAGGLSNTDVFKSWVQAYLKGDAGSADDIGFSDADCRMTVMLLTGDSISSDRVEPEYEGTYLMFDVEAIDNQDAFGVLKEKKALFTTLFGEMPIPSSGFGAAFPNNLEQYGISFEGEGFWVINLLFKAYEEDNAFVGHTGILVDCRKIPSVDTDYLFVEKIAYYDAYRITLVQDEAELLKILSERPDYQVEEGDPKPQVYKNGDWIGELQN